MATLFEAFTNASFFGAYLVRAGEESLKTLAPLLYERAGGSGSPDVLILDHASVGVEEVRQINLFASLRPIGGQKYIVVRTSSMTSEAQHALLKTVEEGSGSSVFFFILPPGAPVLPTLLSRCTTLKLHEKDSGERTAGEEFLALGYAERLKVVEKMGKDSDRESARQLVRSLLSAADKGRFRADSLRDLLRAEQDLALSGSSIKSVIGHLALTL